MKIASRHRAPRPDQLNALFIAADYFEERDDFRLAFLCAREGAEGGDDHCQLQLGNFYSSGTGVVRNLKKAAYWYKKSFNNRQHGIQRSSGAHNLAIDLRNSGDIRGAIAWFKKAIALQDCSSCVELAKIYAKRKGGLPKAIALLHKVKTPEMDAVEWELEEADELLRSLSA